MSDIILSVEHLSKEYGGFSAVSDVSLNIAKGTIHALIGPNGAGKTTLFNMITKFVQPSAGRILFKGRDITDERPARVARSGLVRSFQISAIFPHLTVRDNIRVALQRHLGTCFHFWRSDRSLSALDQRAGELLRSVGLDGYMDSAASELSYGRRRALEIATTIALEPELILLDEPTSGLGREDIEVIATLIRRIGERATVLMVEHNLAVVADLSDRITVLARGSILAEGPYSEIASNPKVRSAYLGAHVG
jgi:branched-chain amino acid transport system ATP-binding protein